MTITIVSVICGLIVSSLVVFISKNKAFSNKAGLRNRNGYFVMRLKTNNKIIVYFCFSFSIIAFVYAIYDSIISSEYSLILLLLGILFIIIGTFTILTTLFDRIEYNDNEISQYRIFRKHPKTISWKNLNNINLHKAGPLLELNSLSEKIYIDCRNNGIGECLKFMEDKLNDKSKMELHRIINTLLR